MCALCIKLVSIGSVIREQRQTRVQWRKHQVRFSRRLRRRTQTAYPVEQQYAQFGALLLFACSDVTTRRLQNGYVQM
jgi:hypothetical protein